MDVATASARRDVAAVMRTMSRNTSAAIVGLVSRNHDRRTAVAAATAANDAARRIRSTRCGTGVTGSILLPKVERHAGDDGVPLEQQRAFDQQRALIVEEMMPPPRRDEFRQDDGDEAVRMLGRHLFDVFEERLHQRPIRRFERNQWNSRLEAIPAATQLLARGGIDVDEYR